MSNLTLNDLKAVTRVFGLTVDQVFETAQRVEESKERDQ